MNILFLFLKARIHCEIFFQTISWNAYFTIVWLCKHRGMFMIYFLRHFMKYKNSDFQNFLSWKTLLLNLFSCLINPFVISGVYKSLKENVSITWKASKVVFVFWEAVVQRCSVKKVLKKETLAQVFSFFIERFWWLLFYFILQKFEGYWRKIGAVFFKIINENDFNDFDAITRFPAYRSHWKLFCKKVFWGVFLPGNLRSSG